MFKKEKLAVTVRKSEQAQVGLSLEKDTRYCKALKASRTKNHF